MTPIDIFGLMREIASNPDDDTLHQIYADHLDESGNEIKSRLVRGTKIEPEWQPLRYEWLKLDGEWKKHQKGKLIYQPEHSNYYKVSQLFAAYPELHLGKHVGKRMYCSLRGTQFTFRWFSPFRCYYQHRCVLLAKRGLVRSVVIDMDTWLKCAGELMRLHPIQDVLLVDKKPTNSARLHTPFHPAFEDENTIDMRLWKLFPDKMMVDITKDVATRRWTGDVRRRENYRNALRDLRKACLTYGINQAKEYLGIA